MFNLKFEKMKKNLEMFKMNKTQMNNVNGGQRIVCTLTDKETREEYSRVYESAVSQEETVDILSDAYEWAFVTCHTVLN